MNDVAPIPSQTGERGEPDSPLDLPASGWKNTLKRTAEEFKHDRGTLVAAGMAFYWFLSVFPALLAAVGITGIVNASAQTIDSIAGAIRSALPGDAARVLTDTLDQAAMRGNGSSVVAAVVGAALALYSASAGMAALQTGLNVMYDVPEDRPFLKKRLRALVLIVVAVVLGGIATALIVFGQPLGEALRDNLPFGSAFVVGWTILRWALGLAALSALFAIFYYLGPNRETPRWAWLSPGGIVATIIWLLASLGFSLYVSSLGSYAETYGSITGVVVLLMWLYLSAIAIVLGAELNAELEREAEKERNGEAADERRAAEGAAEAEAKAKAAPARAKVPAAATAAATTAGNRAAPTETELAAEEPKANGYEENWLEAMRRAREGRNL